MIGVLKRLIGSTRRSSRWAGPLEKDARELRAELDLLQARFDLVRQATTDGLWDMVIGPGNALDVGHPFWWSDQFRRLLGFDNEQDFPNVLGSWSCRLHPEDAPRTLAAFAAHIADRSGCTPYDVSYRLRCRNGEYRWFRAHGKTIRAADGTPLQVAGSLIDLADRNAILGLKRFAEDIIANLPVGLAVIDNTLGLISVNRAFREILDLPHDCCPAGQDLGTMLPHASLLEQARRVLMDGSTRHGIYLDLDGRRLRVALAGIDLEEERRRLLVIVEDVTAEQRLREEARVHAARYRDQASLLDKATDAIIVRGIDHRIQFWNKSAERLYGWSPAEACGQPMPDLLHEDPALVAELGAWLLAHGEWRGELLHRRKDNSTLTVESHWTLVRDEAQLPHSVLVINTDITQRKATEEQIRRLGLYDVLTGLPNRTLFVDRLEQVLEKAQRHGRRLAILFMDLNRFKEINDTRGHGVGDQVLVQVANRFKSVLRGEETLARLAGDEFVVIGETDDVCAGALMAERLERALDEPVATHGGTFSIGVSIGISCYPRDGVTGEELLRCADIAMYRAKATGAGHLCYRPDMSAGLAERMELAKDLQNALSEGKLELYYQPKINLHTWQLVGAEALLRWHDPVRGWISPALFVPIAESRGMIAALGKWVLRQACRQLNAWQAAGLQFPGRLAVNFAARQFDDMVIADNVQAIVSAEGLSPAQFELEITEGTVMNNVERAIDIMAVLKGAGFALSIDDFGTGYSSLSYLKRLPVDKLKIDISFVREMLKDHHDYTIVTTIIGMARNLGLQVIAEGVEEAAQAESLRELGCDEAQGYHIGRPVPAEVFAREWLSAGAGLPTKEAGR